MRALPLLLLLGCGQLDPEVGSTVESAEGCTLVDSDPAADVNFGQVHDELFISRCSCHTIAGGLGQTVGGLDLDTFEATERGGRISKEQIFVPGKPCESVIIQKTDPRNPPPFGARMPLSGFALEDGARQLLIDWIAEGARE